MPSSRSLVFVLLLLPCSLSSSSSAAAPPKVSLALYYESLCPYCSNFIVNYLAKIFTNGLIDIVDLKLVPYGNARVRNDSIACQHGPYECLLNTVEACAIHQWPDVNEHFKFIYCVEQFVVEHQYTKWESCFGRLGLNAQPILSCYKGARGKELELQFAAETDALQPPHRYVPWVIVNGNPLYDDYETFESEVCKVYSGDLPKACEDLPLIMTPTMKANEVKHVSYDNDVLREPTVRLSTV